MATKATKLLGVTSKSVIDELQILAAITPQAEGLAALVGPNKARVLLGTATRSRDERGSSRPAAGPALRRRGRPKIAAGISAVG